MSKGYMGVLLRTLGASTVEDLRVRRRKALVVADVVHPFPYEVGHVNGDYKIRISRDEMSKLVLGGAVVGEDEE